MRHIALPAAMRSAGILLVVLLLPAFLAQSAAADTFPFTFSGVVFVGSADYPVGTPVSGSFLYDNAAPLFSKFDSIFATYKPSVLQLNSTVTAFIATGVEQVAHSITTAGVPGLANGEYDILALSDTDTEAMTAQLSFYDADKSAVGSSLALPAQLDPAQFDYILFGAASPSGWIEAQVTVSATPVPEPASIALFASALAIAPLLRRKRS